MNEVKKATGIEIQLDEQIAQGNYCNLAIIAHSTSEFILDFATMLPGLPKARVKSRAWCSHPSMLSASYYRCRRTSPATRATSARLTSLPSNQ